MTRLYRGKHKRKVRVPLPDSPIYAVIKRPMRGVYLRMVG